MLKLKVVFFHEGNVIIDLVQRHRCEEEGRTEPQRHQS